MKNGGPKGAQEEAKMDPKWSTSGIQRPRGAPRGPKEPKISNLGTKPMPKMDPKLMKNGVEGLALHHELEQGAERLSLSAQASKVGPRAEDHRAESSALQAQTGAESLAIEL